MNKHLVIGAFVFGVIGGCSFQSQFSSYCARSQNCECSAGGDCCVKEGRECSPDDQLRCCGSYQCDSASHRCVLPPTFGGGGGSLGGGGGSVGGGGGGGGSAVDAGSLRDVTLVLIDAGVTINAGIDLQYQYPDGGTPAYFCADGGLVPTWIHADGGITQGECCAPNSETGLCTGATTCTLPGFWNRPGSTCCWCDRDCPEPPDDEEMICPWNTTAPIDPVVAPVPVSQLPLIAFCNDGGGLQVLGGCCTPDTNMTTCSFGSVSCTLDPEGSPCCLVAGFPAGTSNPPVLLNDCRVNGACDCNTTGGCFKNAGAICVDLVP